MAEKTETFLITVAVLEGRHYIWTNMDSAVVVKVDQKKRCTAVKYSTDCPLYNEYFVFEFSTTLENMLEKRIMLTVIQPRSCCRRRKVLGDLNIDMATLWSQENHQFYHKWAILGKKDNFSGPRGYLKVDISMLAKGQVSKIPFGVLNDEIEGNLLLPDGLYQERQKAIYQFDIYKGENLEEKPNISVKDNKTQGGGPNTYIEVTFAGQKVRTSIKKNTHSPVFNERLTIMDLFPPLSQRIKIEICYQESCKKTINAARFLDLKLISNDKEEGFLPTFGPTYLYMYFNHNLGGFAGKILVSMDTELHDILPTDCKTTGTLVQSIPAIIEEQRFEDVILFGMIFGATAISKSCFDRVVSFRMTFGNTLIQKNADAGENCIMNSTNSMKPKKFSKEYYYLPVENEKPSLVITKNLPSCKKRMYNSNMLFKITKELKLKIKSIQEQFESRGYRLSCGEIYDIVIDTLYFIRSSARKYIDIVEEYSFENGTKLDRERQKMCLKEMTSILDRVTKMCANRAKKETLGKIQTLCNRIEALVFDIQDCWPDIHLWMIFGSRKVAFCQIPAREILYSPIDEEKGEYCGKMRTICFYPHPKDKTNLSCKMDLLLWLGAERHKNDCFTSIPQGFTFDRDSVLLSRKILAEQKYEFYLRAHIFQGKISPGFDRTGLADTYVRVVIRDKQKETRPINAKLNPLWDQTLILPDLAFYGSKSYLMENVPNVLMEVWDRDQCKRDDTVGRTLVTPLMKFRDDPYAPPKFPPKLSWIKTYDGAEVLGEILAAFEYIEIPKPEDEFQIPLKEAICPIPPDIKPQMVLHRIEVLFWGVRNLKKLHCSAVNRPRISVICEEAILVSETIENAKKHPNFINKCKSMDVVLPLEKMYAPPLVMKIQDSRRFGIYSYAGVHISDIHSYVFYPLTREERNRRLSEYSLVKRNSDSSMGSFQDMKYQKVHFKDDTPLATLPRYNSSWWKNYLKGLCSYQSKFPYYTCDIPDEQEVVKPPKKKFNLENLFKNLCKCSRKTKSEAGKSVSSLGTYESLPQYDPELEEDFDWWTKFYASLSTAQEDLLCEAADRKPHTLKIYQSELELQPEFDGFNDMLTSFHMYKGKRTGDETVDEENITGIFKGSVRIYRWPQETNDDFVTDRGMPLQNGIFQNYPDNLPVRFLLRVYCVQGLNLRPKDRDGKSDPYLRLTLHDKTINDRENTIPRQVNPVFGKVYEFNGNFPNDHTLRIAIWDSDKRNNDDLIGETEIDIENRFYTKHRAFCGIPDHYAVSGYCAWRGRQKPTAALLELCRTWGLTDPEYQEDFVRIGMKLFITEDFQPSEDTDFDREVLALTVLRRWQEMPVVGFPIVPEHVETRSLYNPSKPGIEQGKMQLWIDIFPVTDLPPPNSVVITPRTPEKYELRVIIWNTEEVKLAEDDFFIGERKSDIYIKGWLTDNRDSQYTDVHYKSLTGEGNFNWRFVFPFEYLSTENKLVIRRKESIFAAEETEFKIPCRLTLQVWDNDTLSRDDFLGKGFLSPKGSLSFELSKMPRGARMAKKCTLSILEPNAPRMNLFKARRTKGWWPFKRFDQQLGKDVLQGKLEAELEIVTSEDADKDPAGLGRQKPQALPVPKRPDVSFSWLSNPLRALKYVTCKLHRWKIIKALLFIIVIAIVFVALYAFPGYTVKRILGAR